MRKAVDVAAQVLLVDAIRFDALHVLFLLLVHLMLQNIVAKTTIPITQFLVHFNASATNIAKAMRQQVVPIRMVHVPFGQTQTGQLESEWHLLLIQRERNKQNQMMKTYVWDSK